MVSSSLAPVPTVYFAGYYSGSQNVPFHEHIGTEIVLVTAGRCAVDVRGAGRLEAEAGEAFVLPAGVAHNQDDFGQKVTTTYAHFTVPAKRFSERPRIVPLPLGSPAAGWLEQLAALQKEPVPPALRGGLALALIEHLAHGERRAEHHRQLHPAVVRAMHRIESDLLEDLTVGDLARAGGVSQSHITALFREHLGCGPMTWVQRQRLELACRLLRNAYLSVADVASSCGYPDANYFTRLFRQAHGTSPTAWRKANA